MLTFATGFAASDKRQNHKNKHFEREVNGNPDFFKVKCKKNHGFLFIRKCKWLKTHWFLRILTDRFAKSLKNTWFSYTFRKSVLLNIGDDFASRKCISTAIFSDETRRFCYARLRKHRVLSVRLAVEMHLVDAKTCFFNATADTVPGAASESVSACRTHILGLNK